jgi:glyoxylase-like metal-dependent hydrolase (beta-lactamase superfamily II)
MDISQKRNDLTAKIAIAIIAQLNHCDRHYCDRRPTFRSQRMLARKSKLFSAALLVALVTSLALQTPAPAAARQHHDQAPGFYRMKVGDLEITALLDGAAVFDPHWLTAKKTTMDRVEEALKEDSHLLDTSDTAFLVNTGRQLILVDAGAGTWFGGGSLGHMVDSLRDAGYAPEQVDRVLVTHLHSDHVGGLTTQDGNRVFPNAEILVSKAESDFWLSPELAAKAAKDSQPFFQSAQAIAAPYIRAGKWHTFSDSDALLDGLRLVSLHGHTPGHTGFEFSSKGKAILFWGDTVHEELVQLNHPDVTVTFDVDHAAAAATRNGLLPGMAREGALIAGPHMPFPGIGRLRKEANGYVWAPVIFTAQWAER